MQRRVFLKHAGAMGAGVALSQLGMFAARAQSSSDYKALVCIFMYGGNDGNNTVVPMDPQGYAAYAAARSVIALPQHSLLPLVESGGVVNFGLHSALGGAAGLQAMWEAKQLAVVTNVGTLVRPLTKAQFLEPAVAKPASLFSHIDQQLQWQAALSTAPFTTGWGGRLADQVATLNTGASIPSMISTAGNNLFVTARAAQSITIPTSGSFAVDGISNITGAARLSALTQLLGVDSGTGLLDAAQQVMTGAVRSSAILNPILNDNSTAVKSFFGGQSSDIARQLLAVAKVIEARATLGARRQVFLVSIGSFDTHSDELSAQQALFGELGPAVKSFHDAMAQIGAGASVTSFTLSDFSRTYQPNTNGGSDHGWGNNHLVMGGAVKGGRFYGTWPTLALGGIDDMSDKGRWIPTTAVDQYAATLGGWFGVDASALAAVLPNLQAFAPTTLGFV